MFRIDNLFLGFIHLLPQSDWEEARYLVVNLALYLQRDLELYLLANVILDLVGDLALHLLLDHILGGFYYFVFLFFLSLYSIVELLDFGGGALLEYQFMSLTGVELQGRA